jgi:hypothetical protein
VNSSPLDSPMMNAPGSHDSTLVNSPGSLEYPIMNTPGVDYVYDKISNPLQACLLELGEVIDEKT